MRLFTSELVKSYKSRTVVNHVTIDVNQGEIVGLLGPNGAGKTTTFYMIVGLIKPNEGSIYLADNDGKITDITKLNLDIILITKQVIYFNSRQTDSKGINGKLRYIIVENTGVVY